jgi:hypothetical protein
VGSEGSGTQFGAGAGWGSPLGEGCGCGAKGSEFGWLVSLFEGSELGVVEEFLWVLLGWVGFGSNTGAPLGVGMALFSSSLLAELLVVPRVLFKSISGE